MRLRAVRLLSCPTCSKSQQVPRNNLVGNSTLTLPAFCPCPSHPPLLFRPSLASALTQPSCPFVRSHPPALLFKPLPTPAPTPPTSLRAVELTQEAHHCSKHVLPSCYLCMPLSLHCCATHARLRQDSHACLEMHPASNTHCLCSFPRWLLHANRLFFPHSLIEFVACFHA